MLLPKYSVPTTILLTSLLLTVGCSPKVQVEVPNEPITINLNVKIEHEVRVKVEKELDDLFKQEDDIF